MASFDELFFVKSDCPEEWVKVSGGSQEKLHKLAWARLLSTLSENEATKDTKNAHQKFVYDMFTSMMRNALKCEDYVAALNLVNAATLGVMVVIKYDDAWISENLKRLWVMVLRYKEDVFNTVLSGNDGQPPQLPSDYYTAAKKLQAAIFLGAKEEAAVAANTALRALMITVKQKSA